MLALIGGGGVVPGELWVSMRGEQLLRANTAHTQRRWWQYGLWRLLCCWEDDTFWICGGKKDISQIAGREKQKNTTTTNETIPNETTWIKDTTDILISYNYLCHLNLFILSHSGTNPAKTP